MAKFAVFEVAFENLVKATGKPKSELTGGTITMLNLGGGVIAGLAAAFISQPADTLLSKMNKTKALPGETTFGRLGKISGELGIKGLFGGLTTRLFMIAVLTSGQFAIYGDIKKALGATAGIELAK